MLTKARKETLTGLCCDLIRAKSYSGEEGAVAARLKEAFTELHFDDFYADGYGNAIGHIKGNRPGPKILFDGHMDTVPVPEPDKWSHNPFSGEIENDRIYGRGASDMKGAIAAMVCAAAWFAEDTGKNFPGDIYVAGVVHEECFEGIASRSISSRINPDCVVIGEASQLNLKIGQRGRAEIVVETYGKPAHSSNPEKGINAVRKMVKLIDRIGQIKSPCHEALGCGILELTDIKSSPYPAASVVPDYCRVTYDRRLLVGETPDSVLKPILDIIAEMEKEDPQFKAKAYYAVGKEKCYTGETIEGERFFPSWLFDKEDKLINEIWDGLKEAGLNSEISYYSFCTNGSHYAGEAGIKTVGFGPSFENLAHIIDEYIDIDQLLKAAEGYYAISKSVLK